MQTNNNETNCSTCARHGITRNNCTDEIVICDLETLVNNGDMNISQIENIMNNIIAHTNMTDDSVIALFAHFVVNKKFSYCKDPKIHIRVLENTNTNTNTKEMYTTFCGICLEDVKSCETASFNCNHSFCGNCVIQTLVHSKNKSQLNCYLCREKVETINIYDDKNIYDRLKETLRTHS